MNEEVITIQDCIDMYEKKGWETLINDGKVKGFIAYRKRNIPATDRKSEQG